MLIRVYLSFKRPLLLIPEIFAISVLSEVLIIFKKMKFYKELTLNQNVIIKWDLIGGFIAKGSLRIYAPKNYNP